MRCVRALNAVVALGTILIGQLSVNQSAAQTAWRPEWRPPDKGIVPDADTAVRVGMAILNAYGPKARLELEEYKPWYAKLADDGAWEVRGKLREDWVGGTYVVVIAKQDGRIIGIFHEQ